MTEIKRELWERIKEESPEIADFVLLAKETFGAIKIESYSPREVDEWYGDRIGESSN